MWVGWVGEDAVGLCDGVDEGKEETAVGCPGEEGLGNGCGNGVRGGGTDHAPHQSHAIFAVKRELSPETGRTLIASARGVS